MSGYMKNASALTLAVVMAGAFSLGAADLANAAAMTATPAANSVLDQTNMNIDHTIRHWNGNAFSVQNTGGLDAFDGTAINTQTQLQPQVVAALKASIRANPALVTKLKSQDVRVDSIAGAATAMDGSLVFYTL